MENAACARRLSAIADQLEARWAEDGSADRELWCIDNWDAVAASVAAAQNVSLGVASHQLCVALALRELAAGRGGVRRRGDLVSGGGCGDRAHRADPDREARAKVDTSWPRASAGGGRCRRPKPRPRSTTGWTATTPPRCGAPRTSARGRHVDVHVATDGSGTASLEALLFAPDADALDQRLDAMAGAVCDGDPRTMEQRRSDALGALGHGGDRLACGCDDPACERRRGAAQHRGGSCRRRRGIADR